MPTTQYIAETNDQNAIEVVWLRQKGTKAARVFDASKDQFDPCEPAEFSGATEAEITRWLLARSKVISS